MYSVDYEDDAAAMISGTNTTVVAFRFGSEYQHLALGGDTLQTELEITNNGECLYHVYDRFKRKIHFLYPLDRDGCCVYFMGTGHSYVIERVRDSLGDYLDGFQKSPLTNIMRELAIIGINAALALKQEAKREVIREEGAKVAKDKFMEKLREVFTFRGIVCGLHNNKPQILVIKTYGQKLE